MREGRGGRGAGHVGDAALFRQLGWRPDNMAAEYLIDEIMVLAYRWAGYALLNWADDAAILALMFC